MPHLTPDVYQMILDGTLPPRTLTRALHLHLLETCRVCAAEWKAARPLRVGAGRGDERLEAAEPSAAIAFSPSSRRLEDDARRVRSTRKQAQQDLRRLLALPVARREERIINARTRYRSRAFVELLIAHCRERVRSAPGEAARLLELVPTCLLWAPDGLAAGWARELHVRGEAHRANALRVAGDLPAAERLFGEVRRRLASFPLADSAVYAEVASLEASLRWDQARHDQATTLLDQAVLIYQDVGEREGLARVLIQRASVAQQFDRHDQALADLERARGLVDPQEQAFLYLFTVVGSVPILLDLERYEEAERVLGDAEDAFEAAAEPWWALRFRGLLGRAALGRGELAQAEELLDGARQGLLEQDLPHDAAAASLDLALVYLHQGRTADVRRLCREIGRIFQGCGVERDALATLALLQQATAVEALAHVSRLRRHLHAARPGPAGPPAAAE
jgi:tetratricopeptide (TPR) repeat protein